MSSEENKAIYRRIIEEVFNQGNFDVADEIFDKNFIGHAAPNEIKGPEGFKQFVSMFRNAFPDIQMTVKDQIAEGDKVASRTISTGTHNGELTGIAPTGRKVTMTAIVIVQFAGGKIVETWSNRDALGMMQQIGAVPTPKVE